MCLAVSSRFFVLLLTINCAGVTLASDAVFRHKSASGSVVFSDTPLVNGQMARTAYQNDYGRPVAYASCRNLTSEQLATRAREFDGAIEDAAARHEVDANLIRAVAEIESCFDPKAVSRVGARGIMQLMPATAAELGVIDSFDAIQNIQGGTDYLAKMLKRFKQDRHLALAAYNAGPGAVEKHRGIPPYPETQDYVKKVLKAYSNAKDKETL